MGFLAKLFASSKNASEEQAAAVDIHNGEEAVGGVSKATIENQPEEIELPGDEVKFNDETSEQNKEIDISI